MAPIMTTLIVVMEMIGDPGLRITGVGILFDANPGNDYCNGSIALLLGGLVVGACLCDCRHVDDLAVILTEKGLDKRPIGK